MAVAEVPTDDTPLDFDPDGNPILGEPITPTGTGGNGDGGGDPTVAPNPSDPTDFDPLTAEPVSEPVPTDFEPLPDDPPLPPPPSDPDDIPEPTNPPGIPSDGRYLRTRYTGIEFSTGPESSESGTWPAFATVLGVRLKTNEVAVSYRWQGFFDFEEGIHNFSWAGNGGYVITVGSITIFNKDLVFNSIAIESQTASKSIPAGQHLVTVEWQWILAAGEGNELGQAAFGFNKIIGESWTNCSDGITREGHAPADWILTESGCWKVPDISDPDDPDNPIPVPPALQIIQVTPDPSLAIERRYVATSGVAVKSHRYRFRNSSTNVTVAIDLTTTSITRLTEIDSDDPVTGFSLQPQEEKFIDVNFLTSALDTLPVGITNEVFFANLLITNVTPETA